ncbi:tRNA (adenosine(37)-N6)-threonylcarbamoyltransferase complex dimerization subunit type 1 TsaB [Alloprevotella sp. OH1205_COT-284]|uniref:tRNA (adenosine(37)-N6)-threonylcarbamoyltransferase complex dimerization subunit type 1 TsaB n=1 Tax=Alloprevotella sp. OH1205_COT-284 TaxID=2491043 RepID=UPI000F5F4E6D|nr:tRNA (adenosine(37)-N6)-threonylcarbamoyltransferase complex dimerization subunit type 1 TsaB [Alloprevotella sp. OH1205_COT-284]RRD80278.1 tRNA (adenosine(37)-N6)-threonylcarbamoyltransferase complex dimerization subunit type 1 TsaB [Alloprevotella sp. OH1205_COT-284]
MSCILHIETSTAVCSVAVSEDSQVIFEQENLIGPNHATVLAPFVDEALSFIESHAIPLDAVAVSSGPGSYTGLRIGVSTAKGVAYGRSVPLIAVPTLKLLTVPTLLYRDDLPDDALLCPMLDARRMEVYAAVYDRALTPLRDVQPDIVDADTYREWLDKSVVYFMGNGAEKCKSVIGHPNARFIDNVHPLAKHMAPLAEKAYARGEFADTAYFEPFYLKEFQTTTPKKIF